MRSKFKWIFTLLVAFSLQVAFAQQKTVTGTVTSAADNMPLPFVNVKVQGVAGGIQTDIDGKYSISVAVGQTLEFSFTGMETVAVKVGAGNVVNASLKDDAALLEEVVVVGYGTTTKEQFTGSAAKVDMSSVEAKTQSNVTQALRGEVAGVNVVTTNGAPGSDAVIRIRGFGSVNGNQAPLYIVDGAPYTSDLTSINPNDIESMTVLKDAAATSIYGNRGANGVILIQTKRGKAGKSVISVDFKTSVNTLFLPNYSVVESPEEYIEMSWDSQRNYAQLSGETNPQQWASDNLYAGATGIDAAYNIWNVDGSQLIDPSTGKFNQGVARKFTPTKWSDAAFGTGVRTEANVQFSGGNDKTTYSTSFGYLDDQGYAINSSYRRYTARLSVDHKPKDWLKVGGNMAYTGARYTNSSSDENASGSSGNIFALTNTTPAIYDVYLRDTDGNLVADPIFGGYQYDYGADPYNRRAWNATNGIADANYDKTRTDSNTLLGNFNVDIDFTDWLSFETRYSGQMQVYEDISVNNPFYGGWASAFGYLYNATTTTTNQNFLQLLRFNKTFGSHSVEAFAAHETTDWGQKTMSASKTRVIIPGSTDLDQYTTPYGQASSYRLGYTLESYFGQLNYNYAQKYFLTSSVRRDGSSRFIRDKWGTFWSVGLGWILSKEDFMSSAKFVDYLKLKASYGVIGDQGPNLRYGWQVYTIEPTGGPYSFVRSNTQINENLTWETSKIWQVGFESTFFDRLDVNVDYYQKRTENLFFNQNLPPSAGFDIIQYNGGVLQNSGFEFDIAGRIIKAAKPEDFSLTLGVNGEILDNEIIEMPRDLYTGELKPIEGTLSVGHSIYDFYMREWAGVDSATGEGLWTMYYNDINSNGVFDSGDENIANMVRYVHDNPGANVQKTTTNTYSQATLNYVGKSAIPKVRGAFRLNATFKNFDFGAQFGYSIGGYAYDNGYAQLMNNSQLIGSNNWHTDMRDRWTQPGDVTNVPRLSSGYSVNDTQVNSQSSRFLTKADYLALNNVRLGYSLPSRFTDRLALSHMNLYVSGDNLMMLSKRKGFNPQTLINSSNSGIYMPMTTVTFGVKVEF